jgi:uncharacterized membrane protein YeaQ/YmgE (transglycosylase-associated protein family)
MISLLLFLLFGFFVGLIARALMPGPQPMGFFATALLGIVGSFAGGAVGSLITGRRITDLHTTGWIASIIGALLVLILVRAFRER